MSAAFWNGFQQIYRSGSKPSFRNIELKTSLLPLITLAQTYSSGHGFLCDFLQRQQQAVWLPQRFSITVTTVTSDEGQTGSYQMSLRFQMKLHHSSLLFPLTTALFPLAKTPFLRSIYFPLILLRVYSFPSISARFALRQNQRSFFSCNRQRCMSSGNNKMDDSINHYPELVVFDLDACFWDQEMYEMSSMPDPSRSIKGDLNGHGHGVVGVTCPGNPPIRLHSGSLQAFQSKINGELPATTRFIFASSADTPFAEKVGRATLKLLEIVPGTTVWDVVVHNDWKGIDHNQIGRQPPKLSSNKSRSHFPNIREATGIRYDRMLFFDDCNWDDHCRMVSSACREPDTGVGPATVRTPSGLSVEKWTEGLRVYNHQTLETLKSKKR